MKKNMRMACEQRLADGSYLSHLYPSERDWRRKTNGLPVRIIDYRLEGIADAKPPSIGSQRLSLTRKRRPRNWQPFIISAGK